MKLALLFLLPLTACGGDNTAAPGTLLVGMSQCTRNEPWRVQMDKDIADAAEQLGVRVVFKDAQDRTATQRSQVEELVAQGIQALIISPKETGPLDRVVRETFRKGIHVIVLDRQVGHDDYTCFIGADNEQIGREAGKWAREAIGGKGVVVMLKGNMQSSPGQLRHKGFLAGIDLDGNPGITIGFQADCDWKQANAQKEMESALVTLPEIALVYGHNDPAAYGAWLAAKDAGRHEKIMFIGIDALPHEGVQYVRQGVLDATFLYPTGGREAVEAAKKLVAGETVPRIITLGTRRYDAANVESGGQEIR